MIEILKQSRELMVVGLAAALVAWAALKRRRGKSEEQRFNQYLQRSTKRLKAVIGDTGALTQLQLGQINALVGETSRAMLAIYLEHEQQNRIKTNANNQHKGQSIWESKASFKSAINNISQSLQHANSIPQRAETMVLSLLQVPAQSYHASNNNRGDKDGQVAFKQYAVGHILPDDEIEFLIKLQIEVLIERGQRIVEWTFEATGHWPIQSRTQVAAVIELLISDEMRCLAGSRYHKPSFDKTTTIKQHHPKLQPLIQRMNDLFDGVVGKIQTLYQKDMEKFMEVMAQGFSQMMKGNQSALLKQLQGAISARDGNPPL